MTLTIQRHTEFFIPANMRCTQRSQHSIKSLLFSILSAALLCAVLVRAANHTPLVDPHPGAPKPIKATFGVPDVRLTNTAPTTAIVGDAIDYTIGLDNSGSVPVLYGSILLVDDQLPPGSTFVGTNVGPGVSAVTCTPSQTGRVSCSVTLASALDPSSTNSVAFTLTATAPPPTGLITNYASVAKDGVSNPPLPGPNCVGHGCSRWVTTVNPGPRRPASGPLRRF